MTVGQYAQAEQIRQMFDRVAPRYDARNRLFSLNRDQYWRRRAARRTALRPGQVAIDLCSGTGKLAHELLPYVRPNGRVIGIDFSTEMLTRARQLEPEVDFRLGDVTHLSDAGQTVDAVTIAFGLRNLVDREAVLQEAYRVLRAGGRFVILEFSPPPRGPLMGLYRLYLHRLMPALAAIRDAGEADAYRYLAQSVEDFWPPKELTSRLERLGFSVSVEFMTLGIVAIHTAIRQH